MLIFKVEYYSPIKLKLTGTEICYKLYNTHLLTRFKNNSSVVWSEDGSVAQSRRLRATDPFKGQTKLLLSSNPVNYFVIHLHFFLVHACTLAYPLDVFNIKSENLVDAPRHCDVNIKSTIGTMKIRPSFNICRQLYIIKDMFLFLCWFLFLNLCYSLFCLVFLVFCHHRVCACFNFFCVYFICTAFMVKIQLTITVLHQ